MDKSKQTQNPKPIEEGTNIKQPSNLTPKSPPKPHPKPGNKE